MIIWKFNSGLLNVKIKSVSIVLVLLWSVTGIRHVTAESIPLPLESNPQKVYWWNNTIFYEIFVRSFYDSNGDGIGDFKGLTQKLDYLNDGDASTDSDLGITGIWLMPMMQSSSYHGYDVVDYFKVDAEYGTMADFKEFVDSAHERGIKVIIDLVMNHSSSRHPWFESAKLDSKSKFRDFYIWRNEHPGWGNWSTHNNSYYYSFFGGWMPDLNYRCTELKKRMNDVVRFWLEETDIDGFRLDAIRYLFEEGKQIQSVPETFEYLEDFRDFYKRISPQVFTVGEIWAPSDEVIRYVGKGRLDSAFEFDLAAAIVSDIQHGRPDKIRMKMKRIHDSYPYLQYATFLANHDQNRVFNQFNQEMEDMKLAAAVLLTLPGIPFLYYGEEIAMTGTKPDENIRKPMQWSAGLNAGFTKGKPWSEINSNFRDFNIEKMRKDSGSLWRWYRILIKARNRYVSLRIGDYVELESDNENVYAFARIIHKEVILVLHNFQDKSIDLSALKWNSFKIQPGEYSVLNVLSGGRLSSIKIESSGDFSDWPESIQLKPKGTLILGMYEEKRVSNQ